MKEGKIAGRRGYPLFLLPGVLLRQFSASVARIAGVLPAIGVRDDFCDALLVLPDRIMAALPKALVFFRANFR